MLKMTIPSQYVLLMLLLLDECSQNDGIAAVIGRGGRGGGAQVYRF